MVERLREKLSTEKLSTRIARMLAALEHEADLPARGRVPRPATARAGAPRSARG